MVGSLNHMIHISSARFCLIHCLNIPNFHPQGTLGAAFAAVVIAVTQSMAGSGLISDSLPIPSAPKILASKGATAPKAAASAPKSKIAFVRGE